MLDISCCTRPAVIGCHGSSHGPRALWLLPISLYCKNSNSHPSCRQEGDKPCWDDQQPARCSPTFPFPLCLAVQLMIIHALSQLLCNVLWVPIWFSHRKIKALFIYYLRNVGTCTSNLCISASAVICDMDLDHLCPTAYKKDHDPKSYAVK